ncbi:hypothetical protein CHUAL_005909 [Chamberlinius hualienensis]
MENFEEEEDSSDLEVVYVHVEEGSNAASNPFEDEDLEPCDEIENIEVITLSGDDESKSDDKTTPERSNESAILKIPGLDLCSFPELSESELRKYPVCLRMDNRLKLNKKPASPVIRPLPPRPIAQVPSTSVSVQKETKSSSADCSQVFRCWCKTEFKSSVLLVNHVVNKHKGEMALSNFNDEQLKQLVDQQIDERRKGPVTPFSFTCSSCEKCSKNGDLFNLKNITDTGELKFICLFCKSKTQLLTSANDQNKTNDPKKRSAPVKIKGNPKTFKSRQDRLTLSIPHVVPDSAPRNENADEIIIDFEAIFNDGVAIKFENQPEEVPEESSSLETPRTPNLYQLSGPFINFKVKIENEADLAGSSSELTGTPTAIANTREEESASINSPVKRRRSERLAKNK